MRTRSPRLGYALAATAATLWALNGSLSRFLLDDHMPPARLAELRSIGTFVAIMGAVALTKPSLLRIDQRDLPRFALFGIVGLAGVAAFYFGAIARLQIGVALTIQYLGPVVLLVWLKLVHRRGLPGNLWGAAAVSVLGCFFVVGAYHPGSLDGIGVLEAFGSTATFALYLFSSEKLGQRYEPATTLAWGFGLSSLFWVITQPPWTFPTHILSHGNNLAYATYMVIGGTLIPFACMIAATRHLPAARAGVVATLEPVLGALLAWPIHDQRLSPLQIGGGLVVIAAIVWVQSQRPQLEAELAPVAGEHPNAQGADPETPGRNTTPARVE
jgi:drug/metabolite transporter (DMT)-like permease